MEVIQGVQPFQKAIAAVRFSTPLLKQDLWRSG